MKLLIKLVMLISMFLTASTSYAEILNGDYYNSFNNGSYVLSITDSTFAGMPIISKQRVTVGSLVYTVNDNNNFHKYYVSTTGMFPLIKIIDDNNDNVYLVHHESMNEARGMTISGVHAYEFRYKVKEILGEPANKTFDYGVKVDYNDIYNPNTKISQRISYKVSPAKETWYYPQQGLKIDFCFGVVQGITLLKNGPAKFDQLGLSANNTLEDFRNKFGGTIVDDTLMMDGCSLKFNNEGLCLALGVD